MNPTSNFLVPARCFRLYEAPGTTKRGTFIVAAGVCAFMYRPGSRRGVTSSLQGNRGVGFFGNVDEEGIGWDSPYLYLSKNMKFANTFGTNTGTINKIISFNERTRRYKVEFVMPDGRKFVDNIHQRDLRGTTPQIMSPVEREFFNKVNGENQ